MEISELEDYICPNCGNSTVEKVVDQGPQGQEYIVYVCSTCQYTTLEGILLDAEEFYY